MKLIKIALLVTFLTFTGCTTYITAAPTVNANLLVKCPDSLPELEGMTGEHFLALAKSWSTQYRECKIRHNGLVDTLNERQSTEVVKWFWEN